MFYFSDILISRYPKIYEDITCHLKEWKTIAGTKNIWARDFLPVHTKNGLVKFKYKTVGYDKYPQLKVPKKCWSDFKPKMSNIILDGGNVEQNDSVVLMTDIVFKHNPDIPKNKLISRLEKLFSKKIIFLPAEPYDDLGHIDGIAKFINNETVFVNDYSGMPETRKYSEYQKTIEKILGTNSLYLIRLPNVWYKRPKMTERQFRKKYPFADDFNSGWGYYINFLVADDVVFVPAFDIPEDKKVVEILTRNYEGKRIVPIDCTDISQEGGLLHCITAEI